MIARVWRARASRRNAGSYAAHLRDVVLPALEKLLGYQGATLLERPDHDDVEILVITWWRSLDDIRAFAGENSGRAVVAAEAARLLQEFDREVRHFDVALDSRPSA